MSATGISTFEDAVIPNGLKRSKDAATDPRRAIGYGHDYPLSRLFHDVQGKRQHL